MLKRVQRSGMFERSEQTSPVLIKRYQNRKLYDTENSTYVTLEDISKIIRHGFDVKIIDNQSKEDLTGITLTQIIFEEEKKRKNLLPIGALKNIIRNGGDIIREMVPKSLNEPTKTTFMESFTTHLQDPTTIENELEHNDLTPVPAENLLNEIHNLRQRVHYLEKKLMVYEKR